MKLSIVSSPEAFIHEIPRRAGNRTGIKISLYTLGNKQKVTPAQPTSQRT